MDHSNTYALLIGASSFPEDSSINAIPNVVANIQSLKNSLTNPNIIGVPESNVMVSLDEDKIQIERKIFSITEKTRTNKHTLLIYFTGHGMLSAEDYQLYLVTHKTSKQFLESDAINIDEFKKYVKRSHAARKILILDCCHSGAIINSMGDMRSQIQADLNGFEGTYVMTSSAEQVASLFPESTPDKPTYFTNKLVEIINEGLDIDCEYCSLRQIFTKIRNDFSTSNLPLPQQSNCNNADEIYFSKNLNYLKRKSNDEIAWEKAVQKNSKWIYYDFIKEFQESKFAEEARKKIDEIEEFECWTEALQKNRVSRYSEYLHQYPKGKYVEVANLNIQLLRKKEELLVTPDATDNSSFKLHANESRNGEENDDQLTKDRDEILRKEKEEKEKLEVAAARQKLEEESIRLEQDKKRQIEEAKRRDFEESERLARLKEDTISRTSEKPSTLEFFQKLFSFSGRIDKKKYLISSLVLFIVYVMVCLCLYYQTIDLSTYYVVFLLLLWVGFAQGSKFCHDYGKSGWYQLIPFYVFYLLFSPENESANEFGKR